MMKVKFAIPKGSLWNETYKTLERAGYVISGHERTYRPVINDPDLELKILRPQEIPVFVAQGSHDIGITGLDWVKETNAEVEVLQNLEYGCVKIVLAVPRTWEKVSTLTDLLKEKLSWKGEVKIATEYLNLTSAYVKSNEYYMEKYGEKEPLIITPWWRKGENRDVKIILSFGATEAKPPENADAIVDATQTGLTLEQNNLKPIENIIKSCALLIANKASLKQKEKREKIFDVLSLLRGVVDARKKIHIFVNVKKENLARLMGKLPALKSPTISSLYKEGWVSVNTVIDKEAFLSLLPDLRKYTQGLVVFEPRQILPFEEIGRKQVKE